MRLHPRLLPIVICLTSGCSTESESEKLSREVNEQAAELGVSGFQSAAGYTDDTDRTSVGWQYAESEDKMRGRRSKLASLDADESIELPFSYGKSTPTSNIRDDPKYGFDVFITANGQFLCRSYNDDTLSIKIDDQPIREWGCANADSGSSEVVSIVRDKAFLSEVRKAQHIIVEANMYAAGQKQMSFTVDGLNWK